MVSTCSKSRACIISVPIRHNGCAIIQSFRITGFFSRSVQHGSRCSGESGTGCAMVPTCCRPGECRGSIQFGCHVWGGIGVTQDIGKAVKWYKLAADQGNSEAQTNLGKLATQWLALLILVKYKLFYEIYYNNLYIQHYMDLFLI